MWRKFEGGREGESVCVLAVNPTCVFPGKNEFGLTCACTQRIY